MYYLVKSKSPRPLVINLEGGNVIRLDARGQEAKVLPEERKTPQLKELERQGLILVQDVRDEKKGDPTTVVDRSVQRREAEESIPFVTKKKK